MFFTGSDWCGWCIRLQKEVLKTPEFATWANVDVNVMNTESYINGRECVITNTNKQSTWIYIY